jgi:alanyl-tRNA synthetase
LDQILASEQAIGTLRVVIAAVDAGQEQLLALLDQLKTKLGRGASVVLIGKEGERAPVVVFLDEQAQARGLKAGEICKLVATELGGGGGGNPTLGRGQGRADRPVEPALEKARAALAGGAAG